MTTKFKSSLVKIEADNDEKGRWCSSAQSRNGSTPLDDMCSVEFCVGKDGSLLLIDENSMDMIYLYREQVKHLKKILGMK